MPALLNFMVTCAMCQLGANTLLGWLKAGDSRDTVVQKAVTLCYSLKLQQKHVCQGVIDSHVDLFMFIYEARKNTDNPLTSDDICYLALFPECPMPGTFYEWSLDIDFLDKKPPEKSPPTVIEGAATMQILHITDAHIEPEYTAGNNALCKEPSCCRKEQGLPSKEGGGAGYWGDYRSCDSPPYAFSNLVQQAAKTHQDVAYVAYTGDSVSHAIWATSVEGNKEVISSVLRELKDAFPDKLILPVLGNHEPHPFNAFSVETSKVEIPANISSKWVYEQSAQEWSVWLSAQGATIGKGGYYSIQVKPGLLVVGLNNNFCYNYNWWLMLDPVDPADQLKWLAETLLKAEEDGQKVHILAHVPGNDASCIKAWRKQYQRIIHRFEHTVVAQFHGHDHTDYFSIYYDPEDPSRATSVAFIAGSATAYTDVNPSYRVYTVEAQGDHRVLDHESWTFNLTEANLAGADVPPNWRKLYSFNEAYGTASMLPAELDVFVNKMAGDVDLLDKFYRHHVREADSALEKGCDPKCKRNMICDIVTYDPDDRSKCDALFKKHDTLKTISEIYEAELLAGEAKEEEERKQAELEKEKNKEVSVETSETIEGEISTQVEITDEISTQAEVTEDTSAQVEVTEDTSGQAEVTEDTSAEAEATEDTSAETEVTEDTSAQAEVTEDTSAQVEINGAVDVEQGDNDMEAKKSEDLKIEIQKPPEKTAGFVSKESFFGIKSKAQGEKTAKKPYVSAFKGKSSSGKEEIEARMIVEHGVDEEKQAELKAERSVEGNVEIGGEKSTETAETDGGDITAGVVYKVEAESEKSANLGIEKSVEVTAVIDKSVNTTGENTGVTSENEKNLEVGVEKSVEITAATDGDKSIDINAEKSGLTTEIGKTVEVGVEKSVDITSGTDDVGKPSVTVESGKDVEVTVEKSVDIATSVSPDDKPTDIKEESSILTTEPVNTLEVTVEKSVETSKTDDATVSGEVQIQSSAEVNKKSGTKTSEAIINDYDREIATEQMTTDADAETISMDSHHNMLKVPLMEMQASPTYYNKGLHIGAAIAAAKRKNVNPVVEFSKSLGLELGLGLGLGVNAEKS